MSAELKACPFCGGEIDVPGSPITRDIKTARHPSNDCILSGQNWWMVPRFIDPWNRRTDLSQASVAAALEAAAVLCDEASVYREKQLATQHVDPATRDRWYGGSKQATLLAEAIRALITDAQHDALAAHVAAEVAKARAEDAAELQAAADKDAENMAALANELRWYGEQARLCRLIHSEGDAGRHALNNDGGKRAAAALSTPATEPQGYVEGLGLSEIREAVGRGWCHLVNSTKVMDTDLAEAIAQEIAHALAARPAPQPAADTRVVTVPQLERAMNVAREAGEIGVWRELNAIVGGVVS